MSVTTRSGVPLQRAYTANGGGGERPGEFPFTRGRLSNPKHTTWIQRELSGEGNGERSNEQIRYLLEHGQTGIDVIGDAPTQSLLDPDHPLAREAVGTQGVSLCRKQDFLDLLKDLPLGQVSISSSVPAFFTLPGLVLAAREAGFPLDRLRGSILHGPLYAEDCSYAVHLPVEFRVRLALDAIEYCSQHMPKFHAYLEDTYFFCESGLTPVEEMALGFVQLRHLVRKLVARGVGIDSFAPRIAFLVNCSMDFFEEIAKIRATRRLYAKIMRDEFGTSDPRSISVAITSHTSGLSLTAQQPINNVIRGTVQALSMVLAGVQALEISAFDEAYRTPSKSGFVPSKSWSSNQALVRFLIRSAAPIFWNRRPTNSNNEFARVLTKSRRSVIRKHCQRVAFFVTYSTRQWKNRSAVSRKATCLSSASTSIRWMRRTTSCCVTLPLLKSRPGIAIPRKLSASKGNVIVQKCVKDSAG
jgi:methylmalonyl-CoA mutase cobalamin-binding domain/chain